MRQIRGPLAAALAVLGAAVLLGSLFLTWSHQISPAEHRVFHGAVLFGVPANPDAWQVYAIAGEVLAVLATAIGAAGLWGQRRGRAATLVAVVIGLIFVIGAASSAPTNGLLLATGAGAAARYMSDPATAGAGETVAIIGLVLGGLGLVVGAGSDRPAARTWRSPRR